MPLSSRWTPHDVYTNPQVPSLPAHVTLPFSSPPLCPSLQDVTFALHAISLSSLVPRSCRNCVELCVCHEREIRKDKETFD